MAHPHKRISNSELLACAQRLSACGHAQAGASRRIEKPHIGRPVKSSLVGGGEMSGDINSRKKAPIKMKQMLADRNISNAKMALHILHQNGRHVSGSAISLTLNHGYLAATIPRYKEQVEAALRSFNFSDDNIKAAWEKETNVIQLGTKPFNRGDAEDRRELAKILKEPVMLTSTALRHFKIFADPFMADIRGPEDIFMSENQEYVLAAMTHAATHEGFVAVSGESGSGKTVMRQRMIDSLKRRGGVRIIEPQIIDKKHMTSAHLLDAILYDLDEYTRPKNSLEAKARQVKKFLTNSSRSGKTHILLIEEAHDMSIHGLKLLKRLWEMEDGYKRLLGIELIGQPELRSKLNIEDHYEAREVIYRCHLASLGPLSADDCNRYLRFKFERSNINPDHVIAKDCAEAVMKRLTTNRGVLISYPLAINNTVTNAINYAAKIGAPLVTAEIIQGV